MERTVQFPAQLQGGLKNGFQFHRMLAGKLPEHIVQKLIFFPAQFLPEFRLLFPGIGGEFPVFRVIPRAAHAAERNKFI